MKLFSCHKCEQVLFFENCACMNCQSSLAFCPEVADFVPLPAGGDQPGASIAMVLPGGKSETFRRCKNFETELACNWLVMEEDEPYCLSCRLSEVIPDLSDAANLVAWLEIERAKRRLLYTLFALRLPVSSKARDPQAGLTFKFLRDTADAKVLTGHADGVITLNIAEADSAYRENARERLGEGYRTLLGHLRHEIGHYYWDRLIRDSAALEPCRALFGDDRQSYADSLQRHYEQGPPANWADSFISAYATMHPWEDWAETWAHYLHMVDTLETAKSHGLTLRILGTNTGAQVATEALVFRDFESLIAGWHSVSLVLNNLNRSMGMKDAYPFVLSPAVQEKLRFIHDVIQHPPAQRAEDLVTQAPVAEPQAPAVAPPAPAAAPQAPAAAG